MKCKLIAAVIFASILLTGCAQKTPMQILQSDTAYPDLTEQFWAHQRVTKQPLWKEAKAYCLQNMNKVNCVPVMRQMPFDDSTTVPKYGSSGHYLTVPNF